MHSDAEQEQCAGFSFLRTEEILPNAPSKMPISPLQLLDNKVKEGTERCNKGPRPNFLPSFISSLQLEDFHFHMIGNCVSLGFGLLAI